MFHDHRVAANSIPEYGDIKGRLKPICIITQTYISDLKCKERQFKYRPFLHDVTEATLVIIIIIIIIIIIFIQDDPVSVINTVIKGVLLLKYIRENAKSLKGKN